jgi:pilus assembly protein CpaD
MCALNNPRRIFFDRPKRSPRVAAFTVTLLLALGACRTVDAPPATTGAANQLSAIVTETRHAVAFGTGAASPDTGSRRAFEDFVGGRRSDERFTLVAADNELGGRRAASVAALLRSRGVPRSRIFIIQGALGEGAGPEGPDGAVTVVARRYTVTAPDCPDWSAPVAGNSQNRPTSNFGCATALNLKAMIADPADLAGGRDPGPDDGIASVRSVQLWREGKVSAPADPTKDE